MFNYNKMFFMFMLFNSTLISISSNSWLGCWIGLEINLLSFIPLMTKSNNLMNSESSLKYFLVQSIASINFLFTIIMKMIFMKMFEFNNMLTMMINSTLLMKMGCAPFHFWFLNIIEGLSWMNCFILLTWQKITPMILLSYYYNTYYIYIIIIITSIMGAVSGLNQTSLRKLLASSSINHMSWMLMAIMISEMLWLMYFFIYLFLLMLLCSYMNMLNFYFMNQFFFNKMNKLIKLSMFLNMLSLGGLPPFMGFLSKWLIVNFMINNNFMIIASILVMMSIITLFFYIRITYSAFMFNYTKLKWIKMMTKNKFMNFINLISFFSLIGLINVTFIYI